MSGMGGMPMPGGWAMSITMMAAMMAAMMLPSSVPLLWRHYHYHAIGRANGVRPGWSTALVGAGYFTIWSVLGAAVVPLVGASTAIGMWEPDLARAMRILAGVVVLLAGSLQLTRWKARRLACLRATPPQEDSQATGASAAWRHGLRLGLDCAWCCAGLMAMPLVVGTMHLGAMAAVTAAVTAERLAPATMRVERAIGVLVVVAGLCMITRAGIQ